MTINSTSAGASGILRTDYNATFFAEQIEGSLRSACGIVPFVVDLIEPKSVLDVGCGLGPWLLAFHDAGVEDIHGIDGEYVDQSQLLIPVERFRAADLNRPVPLDRIYDLAISLEVAEHLEPKISADFVRLLTLAAPVVLFSAAIPRQGGTNHINEQWPWFWKDLFAAQGYIRLDAIRPRVWRDPAVEWWYKQNIFLYVRSDFLASHAKLSVAAEEFIELGHSGLELVGESILRRIASPTLRPAWAMFRGALWRAIARRVGL